MNVCSIAAAMFFAHIQLPSGCGKKLRRAGGRERDMSKSSFSYPTIVSLIVAFVGRKVLRLFKKKKRKLMRCFLLNQDFSIPHHDVYALLLLGGHHYSI